MNRPLRTVAALATAALLAFAASLFVARRAELPGRDVASQVLAVASTAGGGSAASGPDIAGKSNAPDPNYELEKLPVLSRVVISVKDNYVDQRRVDAKAMVAAALDGVEKAVAEVMVEGDPRVGKFAVTVGSAQRQFDASSVKTPWEARGVLAEVMGFVKKHLVAHKDLREVEYAAVNGLLSTLDPHSILLEPKMYREMRLATKGEFGGLGFVIAMRDGNLTVVRVLKNTPAQKAGIRAKDVITRIEEQSTINMDLQDAVDRLRGKPATRVSLTVNRAGWTEPRRFQLQREIIAVETVPQSKLLDGGVGYVKLSQFSANTTRDLVSSFTQLKAQAGGGLKGLVLDLRGNPGGLLEQAIQVSDLFLSQGVIVKTVGEGMRMHEVKEATADRDDVVGLPLVVIVNNSSASASEIVAGALKNNDRALVIGRQTFGKGSVQVLYDFSDPSRQGEESALKLTIAQYLTPGDLSIQEVGVGPDVLLLPGRALKDAVNYFAPPRMMGEADLERHFSNPTELALSDAEKAKRAKERENRTEKAALELRYLLDEKEDKVAKQLANDEKRAAMAKAHGEIGELGELELTPEQQEDDDAEANPDEVVEDYQIRFAREVLVRATAPQRGKLLETARTLVSERKGEEASRLGQKLAALGVDWSSGPAGGTPRAHVTVTPPPGKAATAGETLPWTITVENKGDGAFRRLRGWTRVEKNALLDRREFVFGSLKAGERRSWTVPVKLPKGMDSRHDAVTLQFEEENGNAPQPIAAAVDVVETKKPAFAFSAQVEDETGNGDGLVQRGEKLTLRVDVKNAGEGASGEKTFISLKNLGDEKIFIEKGREVLGAIKPGESKAALLTLEVKKGGKGDTVPLRLMVVDEKLDEFISERLELPLREGKAKAAASGAVRVSAAETVLRTGAAQDAAAVAVAKKGAVLPVQGRWGEFYRVEWAKGRHGFAAASDVAPTTGPAKTAATGAIAAAWQREPPRIELVPDPAKGAPVVQADTFRISGVASVPPGVAGAATRLRDVFVFVNDQKVFFKVVPESGASTRMEFQADVPLKPGNNVVTVFAREDEEYQSRRTFVVHRGAAAEVAQQGAQR
jgi:carboxyl-terminal processing protease